MRKQIRPVLSCVFTLSFLVSCGGGGGGGGGGASSHGIRLIHASIEDAPLSMTSSLAPLNELQTARFAEATLYSPLPKGEQHITVDGGQVGGVSSAPFTVDGRERLSALFYRDVAGDVPRVAVISDIPPELSKTQAAVRVLHALAGAAALDVTIAGTHSIVAFADAGEYAVVAPGPVNITAARHADGYPAASQSLSLEAGKAYTLVLSGEAGYFTASSLFAG